MPADVMIISQSFLKGSVKEKMDALQSEVDSPATVVLSDSADPATHAQLMTDGCDAVLYSGLAVEQIRNVIETILEKRSRLAQKRFFAPQPLAEPRLSDFVSQSSGMASFMNLVPRVVQSESTLLLEGETGVGKERLASAIHSEGPRSNGRFVALNCGALPEHLIESELFGYVRGAFTGATASRRGWFEIAHNGTLFLDEVGEIPVHLQVKLLRAIQEHEVQPIGSEKSFSVDVRIIAASNRPLESDVESGHFRRDLYHRLSVVKVVIPPLREHPEDIPTLVNRHIPYISRQLGRRVSGISEKAMDVLCRYSWPGNLRELNNVIERAILLCDDMEIDLVHLADPSERTLGKGISVQKAESPRDHSETDSTHHLRLPKHWLGKQLKDVREYLLFDLERQYIEGLLIAAKGRIGEAANKAGILERSLYGKMKKLGIRKEAFRS
ncbi:MAG: sigma-54 dependent transcriptional regulator [Planctomycetes bacterium]|nr:sigma-54 dependent transcriptional regulator [Planctomycetota bacterium]